MKNVILMRHADAAENSSGMSDHDRPLSPRGITDARAIGERLGQLGFVPDLIVSSSAVRALQTAELVKTAAGWDVSLETERDLYLAGPEAYFSAFAELDTSLTTVLAVGHNPGMGSLAYSMTGRGVAFSTACVARVALAVENWEEVPGCTNGELADFFGPGG